jgi:hypothetical protein
MENSAEKPKHSMSNPFAHTGLGMGILILLTFILVVVITICVIYTASVSNYLKQQSLNQLHLTGSVMDAEGKIATATSTTAASLASAGATKNTFASVPIGGSAYPFISPAEYGNGSKPAMTVGSELSRAIYDGSSWNMPNAGGCDCSSTGTFNTIYSSSHNQSDANSIPTTSSSSAAAASEQAAFYATLNGGNMNSNDFSGMSSSGQLLSDSSMSNNELNQYGINSSNMGGMF